MPAAIRSMPEWIASERIDTDPDTTPTTSLATIRIVLDRTDRRAAPFFLSAVFFRNHQLLLLFNADRVF